MPDRAFVVRSIVLAFAVLAVASGAGAQMSESVSKSAVAASPATANDDAVSSWMKSAVTPSSESNKVLRRGAPGHSAARSERQSGAARADVGAVRLVWPMVVVLGLITAAALAARRWLPMAVKPASGRGIHILARHYLSGKQSLCLLRLGRRVMLIGVTPDRISSLAEVQDEDESARIIGSIERARPGSFTSVFSGYSTPGATESAEAEQAVSERPFASRQSVRAGVRDLVEKIRSLSGSGAPVEPA